MRFTSPDSILVLHRYVIRGQKGEGWAVVTIGSDGSFTALSDWGNYGHFWAHHGCKDAREFFLRAEGSFSYFVGKLSMGTPDVYDGAATVQSIKEYILDSRRHDGMTATKAREEWDRLSDFDLAEDEGAFARWYDETEIADAYEFARRKAQPQVTSFVRKIMVEKLGPMIQAELDAERAEAATCPP